jgi:hypothetical protein
VTVIARPGLAADDADDAGAFSEDDAGELALDVPGAADPPVTGEPLLHALATARTATAPRHQPIRAATLRSASGMRPHLRASSSSGLINTLGFETPRR